MKTTAVATFAVLLGTGAAFAQAVSGGMEGGSPGDTNASPSNQGPETARQAPAGGPRAQANGQVPGGDVYDGRPAIPAFGPIPPGAG